MRLCWKCATASWNTNKKINTFKFSVMNYDWENKLRKSSNNVIFFLKTFPLKLSFVVITQNQISKNRVMSFIKSFNIRWGQINQKGGKVWGNYPQLGHAGVCIIPYRGMGETEISGQSCIRLLITFILKPRNKAKTPFIGLYTNHICSPVNPSNLEQLW